MPFLRIVPIVLAFKFSTLTGIIEYYAGWQLTPDQIDAGESRWFLAVWAEFCARHDRPTGLPLIDALDRYQDSVAGRG